MTETSDRSRDRAAAVRATPDRLPDGDRGGTPDRSTGARSGEHGAAHHGTGARAGGAGAPSPAAITLRTAAVALTAVVLLIQLHEYAHAVAAVVLVGEATVFGAMADHPATSDTNLAIVAIAGPAFSAVTGALVWALSRGLPTGYARALLTWFGLGSMQCAFGYLMIALIAPVGDTAVAFEAWGLPLWVSVVSFVVGLGGMFLNAYLLAGEITRTFSEAGPFRCASVWAWLVATGGIAALYVAVAIIAGVDGQVLVWTIVGPATALVFAPMSTFFWQKVPHRNLPWSVGSTPVIVGGVVVALAVALVHAVVGIKLG